MVQLRVDHLPPTKQLDLHYAVVSVVSTTGDIRSRSGKRSIHDSASLLPSIWNLVIHFIKSIRYRNTVWAAFTRVVSVYSWNTLLLFYLAVLIHLGQVTFCRQVLLLICFSGLGPISLVLAQWCHTKHLLHLQMQTMKSSHQNRRNLCCHLGCRHQWAALMRLPLSHSTWLIVIIGLCVHCIRPSGTISAPLPCGTDVLQLR